MTIYYDTLVLSTIEKIGLQSLLANNEFGYVQQYCDLVYSINAATPYRHYDYVSARFCMMEQLTYLVGERLAEILDNEQLDSGETFHWCAQRILSEVTTADRFPLDEV